MIEMFFILFPVGEEQYTGIILLVWAAPGRRVVDSRFMPFRAAVVGAGGVADRIHLPACRAVPEIEIAGICDLNTALCEETAKKFGVEKSFASVGAMLDAVRPDFVIVGTPPGSHFQICEQAMRAGAHVFCEKPFMRSKTPTGSSP
jgi:predicted dehydrogenase